MTPGDRGLEGPQASAPRAKPERPDRGGGGEEAEREGAKEGGGLASWSRQAAGARASLVESASPQRRRTQPEVRGPLPGPPRVSAPPPPRPASCLGSPLPRPLLPSHLLFLPWRTP